MNLLFLGLVVGGIFIVVAVCYFLLSDSDEEREEDAKGKEHKMNIQDADAPPLPGETTKETAKRFRNFHAYYKLNEAVMGTAQRLDEPDEVYIRRFMLARLKQIERSSKLLACMDSKISHNTGEEIASGMMANYRRRIAKSGIVL